ncbi:hypothetical protein PENARI_c005G02627 [Penicillium arizonense]|uniref:GXWXG domain-containing protein n=1 Tax=Penicillium arizonense TaxID=1835702 RepID=A0A1F5LPF9_PENAI|nr:hypothetical protein PENARI_c005G02627 [Penicillium arizonense]OGE55094.1 hypothetical protein PENARI_c005G02627 [Penicillium arizonense]
MKFRGEHKKWKDELAFYRSDPGKSSNGIISEVVAHLLKPPNSTPTRLNLAIDTITERDKQTHNMSSAGEEWIALTQATSIVSECDVEAVFHQLSPVSPESLLGEWRGADLNTGHPGVEKNKELKWAGKSFVSIDDVKPMMVYGDDGMRVWLEAIGSARLREVKYHNIVSTAMIYNNQPIIDHFRKVNDTMVAGVMDTPLFKDGGLYYFYLTKLPQDSLL